MSLTMSNKSNLPEALVKAIQNDGYNKGDCDYSVTELLKPARQRRLQALHSGEVSEDVEDCIYRLYGQIAHTILERANENDISEKRFFADFNGKTVSGQIDTLSITDGVLSDYKFTTSWGFKTDQPAKPDWVAQLHMQLEILRRNGLDARALQIVGLLRDWQMREARKNENYPRAPIAILPIEMWSREQTTAYVNLRISEHESAKTVLPLCTPEDQWAKPDTYAVMKGARAIPGGLQATESVAIELSKRSPGTRVEFRKGERIRCDSYCSVSDFCEQYKAEKEQDEI